MASAEINYRRPILEVDYDFVWIVDGLPPDQTKRYGLTRALGSQLRHAGVSVNLSYCASRAHVLRAVQHMSLVGAAGASFPVHFICHGNKNGLAMGKEFVTWPELTPCLTRLNGLMDGNLILNLTSCFGLFGLKTVACDAALHPFFGLFGSNRKLGVNEAAAINARFYELWLGRNDLSAIVKSINKERGSEVLFCGSAEGIAALRSRK